jgi:hypothetical protein
MGSNRWWRRREREESVLKVVMEVPAASVVKI